jgi:MinD superfamily P-loop ATPase
VQEYLEKSQIPLLMEIPFKKEYAELYSESKLMVNTDEEMRKAFLELFENVKSQYLQKAMYR